MVCDICNHYALTVIGEDKLQCNKCGHVQEDRDWSKCQECGERIPNEEFDQHCVEEHGYDLPHLVEGGRAD